MATIQHCSQQFLLYRGSDVDFAWETDPLDLMITTFPIFSKERRGIGTIAKNELDRRLLSGDWDLMPWRLSHPFIKYEQREVKIVSAKGVY